MLKHKITYRIKDKKILYLAYNEAIIVPSILKELTNEVKLECSKEDLKLISDLEEYYFKDYNFVSELLPHQRIATIPNIRSACVEFESRLKSLKSQLNLLKKCEKDGNFQY